MARTRLGSIERGIAALLCAGYFYAAPALAQTASQDEKNKDQWRVEWAEYVGQEYVKILAEACPPAATGDKAAFDSCREKLFGDKFLHENMRDYVLWGGGKAGAPVEQLNLTQFDRSIYRGLYLSLFMFTGESWTEVLPEQNRLLVHVVTRFRNTLKPGEYPYPFWHAAEKWGAYQTVNNLAITIDLKDAKILAFQRTDGGKDAQNIAFTPAGPPRAFNKDEWMWQDENGQLQPKVTLYDGLYHPDNPHLSSLEKTYFDFALEMRNNTCMVCHVPNNPEKMRHLVLLQTPAHAAGEIGRIIRAVKADAMPGKSWAGPKGIKDPKAKEKFLAYAEAFKTQVDAAAAWEVEHSVVK